ncbi:MAG TPA: lytic transglycosylase domain-containing protein [Luteimonas sp.]|nr:lytic transglycosylase domain-containing protein [Luteimonas sp.]
MKGVRGILAVLCLLAAAPAVAGTVYRCDRADGVRSYSSKRIAGAGCVAVSSYHASRVRTPPAKAPAPAASAPASAAAMGSVTPANPVEGSPVQAVVPVAAPATPAPMPYQAPHLVRGQVYSYIQDGVRHYTSRAPKGGAGITAMRTIRYSFMETCYACAARPGVDFNTLRLNTNAYQAEIAAASRDYGVDQAIVRAIIHAESAFNPNALSRVGAQGLMQLMPATARRFGVGNAFDAAQNIRGGVQYLAFLLKRFNGDLSLVAAGYNAGEGAVDKYKGVPPYSETQRYVQRVALLAQRYRGGFASR